MINNSNEDRLISQLDSLSIKEDHLHHQMSANASSHNNFQKYAGIINPNNPANMAGSGLNPNLHLLSAAELVLGNSNHDDILPFTIDYGNKMLFEDSDTHHKK
jgi:hypothetical protein